MSPPFSIIAALITFDHKAGPVVQCHYPQQAPAALLSALPAYALPDAIHKHNLDFVYFRADAAVPTEECVLGVSCFKQCPTDQVQRGFAQRAMLVGVVQPASDPCSISTYYSLQSSLSHPARQFFERPSADCNPLDVLKSLYDGATTSLNAALSSGRCFNTTVLFTLRKLTTSAAEQALIVIKAVNAGAKVVIFSESSLHHLTATVLAFASLASEQVSVLPYVPIQFFDNHLPRMKYFLIGTNNQIAFRRSAANVLFDIDNYEIRIEYGVWGDVLRLSRADRRFAAKLAQPENSNSIAVLYKDYQNRAIHNLQLSLKSNPENEDDLGDAIDDILKDFNTCWAGIMFGFIKHQPEAGQGLDRYQTHPCHEEGEGEDVFGDDSNMAAILNSISQQTATIGDKAQRSFWEVSTKVTSWVASMTQSISSNDPECDDIASDSVWTD